MSFFSCVLRMIRRRPQAYVGLFLNEVVSVVAIFAYATLFFHPQIELFKQGMSMSMQMLFSSFSIAVFSSPIFPIYYSLTTLYRSQQRQFGAFLLLGMRPWYLRLWLLWETVILGGCAVVVGMGLGIALNVGLLSLVEKTFTYIDLPFVFSWTAFFAATAMALALFVVAALIMPFFIQRRKLLALLQSDRRVDDKKALPIGFLRALLAVLCFGAFVFLCFFLPVQIGLGGNALWVLYACFFLAAMGSHFFYKQSSLYLANFFRWKKKFSWKNTRLLWIGDIVHRLKDNARFFHDFSMALMLALMVTGVGVAATRLPVDEIVSTLEKVDPKMESALFYHLGKEGEVSPKAEENLQAMDALLVPQGLVRVDANVLVYQKKMLFISLPAYNQMRKAAGRPPRSLAGDAAERLCEREDCFDSPSPVDSHSLPKEWGIQEVEKWGPTRVVIPPWEGHGKNPPQWVLGEQAYQKVAQVPGIQKLRGVHYFMPDEAMTTQRLEALVQSQALRQETLFGVPLVDPDSFVYSPVVTKYERILAGILFLISLLLTSPISLIAAVNMIFFRVYNGMEARRQQFQNLLRVGIPLRQLQKSVVMQLGLISFIPVVLASFLAWGQVYYGARFLEHWLDVNMEVGNELFLSTGIVIGGWLALQIALFFPLRAWILRKINRQWV